MAPTRDAPVVRLSKDGERHLDALKWGLVPYFTKDLKKARKPINARSETVATSGMFREAFAKRRCLVPAPVYYEWRDDPGGQDAVRRGARGRGSGRVRRDMGGVAIAGGRAPPDLRHDHDGREPAAGPDPGPHAGDRRAADWPLWLGEADGDVAGLLRPAPEDALRFWPVDKKVGNVRNDGPELIEPVVPAEAALL